MSQRTDNYLRQLRGAFVYKGASVAASLLALPLMIRYVGAEQFGVWSTLLAISTWVVFFDLGIGNGLRNKVAEALSQDQEGTAADYVASAYTLVGAAVALLAVAGAGVALLVPWQRVFNTAAVPEVTLKWTVFTAISFTLINFWTGLVSALLGALQKTAVAALGHLLFNLAVLVLLWLANRTTEPSITYLAVIYGASLLAANVAVSVWLFCSRPNLRPRFLLCKQHLQPLLSVGGQFFLIQLAVLLIFTTDKILITQILGPAYVADYEVVFRLFSLVTLAHAMVVMPLWSAYTDAYHSRDVGWIKRTVRQQLHVFAGFVVAFTVLCLLADPLIRLWIGPQQYVSASLVLAMASLGLVMCWNNVFAMVVNGVGLLKPQLAAASVAAFVNIPLNIFLAKYMGLGVTGIVIGTACSLMIAGIVLPLQVRSLFFTEEVR